jgi:chromosome segregation ATPase
MAGQSGKRAAEPRFLRETDAGEGEPVVTVTDLLERLERQAGELGALHERLSAADAALSAEHKRREQLEQRLAEAAQAEARVDKAAAIVKRERAARRRAEEELAGAEEEIEALRTEVDHAWKRLQDLQEPPPPESRWRLRRGQASD